MDSSLPLQYCLTHSSVFGGKRQSSDAGNRRRTSYAIRASISTPPYRLFESPHVEESSSEVVSLMPCLCPYLFLFICVAGICGPDFYKIGYVRSVRAYGVEFKEGPDGFGIIMEIPLELMLTISKKLPWMFFPDVVPVGHPIFDIINSTKPESDWDLRLACLLLFALDLEGNFWQLYGDFLPSLDECTSLLLASKDELLELQDQNLASKIKTQQQRAIEFWEKHWHSAAPLRIKRLAQDSERFMWALGIVQTRSYHMQMRVGALVQDANMLVPYADMLNHSFQPNCFLHWRFKDRMLEVLINAGQRIRKGDEMTICYMSGQKNDMLMERYWFFVNPWDNIPFSGGAKVHLDSFLSVFNISGLPEGYYHNNNLSAGEDFVDGAVIAAARTLPSWSEGTLPQSQVQRGMLQGSCRRNAIKYWRYSDPQMSRTLQASVKYVSVAPEIVIEKVIQALELYQDRILF
ncbi:unnamed protein product [Spirodela intermedia]|uniref:SET domain-containing protein n=1 Tax=Spirodela intermedia TaxID=51605 RepID=A0A7I8JR23_SPIIN|nr:unnamed protein product [Spirodela intermedia]CAA6671892.1 unnamed protein product [Spirodela intermedia]